MNITLKQISQYADDTHKKIFLEKNTTVRDYCNHILLLRAYSEQLNLLSLQVEKIYNACQKEVTDSLQLDAPILHIPDNICVAPGIFFNKDEVHVVEDESNISNTKLYYVKNINQFAIKINKVLIRGNIGNISQFDQSIVNSKNPNVITCKYTLCEDDSCSFYHDPLLHKNKPAAVRNFTNSQMMYSSSKRCASNRNMNHVGHRNTLKIDIEKISKMEIQKLQNELDIHQSRSMHFLLTHLSIMKCMPLEKLIELEKRY